jgi:hypothetical protein
MEESEIFLSYSQPAAPAAPWRELFPDFFLPSLFNPIAAAPLREPPPLARCGLKSPRSGVNPLAS